MFLAFFGELSVFRQKPVARVYRFGAGHSAADSRLRTFQIRPRSSGGPMQTASSASNTGSDDSSGLGIGHHRFDAELTRRAQNA